MKQCPSCGGVKDRGHQCPTIKPVASITIDGREYAVPEEVADTFLSVSLERDELEAFNQQLLTDKNASPAVIAGYREHSEALQEELKLLRTSFCEVVSEREQLKEKLELMIECITALDYTVPKFAKWFDKDGKAL